MAENASKFDTSRTPKYVAHKRKADDEQSVWFYFLTETVNGSTAKCKKCQAVLQTKGGSTKGLLTHLLKLHEIDVKAKRNLPSESESKVGPSSSCTSAASTSRFCFSSERKQTKIFDFFSFKTDKSLDAQLARMVSVDNIPFSKFVTSVDLRNLFAASGMELPNSATTIRTKVMKYCERARLMMRDKLKTCKQTGKKFTVSFDEWSSGSNKHYMNINLHHEERIWNLGLVRIRNSMTAETCLKVLEDRLAEYGLSLDEDIVCFVTDGSSTMIKIGKLVSPKQQLCLAHGIQLAVIDVIYKRHSIEKPSQKSDAYETDDDSTEEVEEQDEDENQTIQFLDVNVNAELSKKYNLGNIIAKVRKIVRCFRKSPTKNDLLQKYVKEEHGKEMKLQLDCKTRWSSLFSMVQRFCLLKNCIKKALIDLNLEFLVENEYQVIKHLTEILEPVKLTVEALCRQDMNLLKADIAFKFLIEELERQSSPLSNDLKKSIETRLQQRSTVFSGVLRYLHDPSQKETGGLFQVLKAEFVKQELVALLERLQESKYLVEIVPDSSDDEENVPISTLMQLQDRSEEKQVSLSEKLTQALNRDISLAPIIPASKTPSMEVKVSQEMEIFQNGGQRGPNLQFAYDILCNIPPTSVEAERCFSAAGLILTKFRSSMSDETLDNLIFLRYFFKEKN